MGDMADGILEGIFCQVCGVYMGEDAGDGFPVTCEACMEED